MKKVILLVLVVMLVSVFLTAADHPLNLLRLTAINKSGNEIYLRLQSETHTGGQFYYLTIPAGTKDIPYVEVFTVAEDVYFRTTWYGPGDNAMCEGMMDTGRLTMDRNNRLVFLPCNAIPMRKVSMFDFDFDLDDWCDYHDCKGYDWWNDYDFDFDMDDMIRREVNIGEPSMEKVIYSGWQEVMKEKYKEADSNSLFGNLPFDFDNLPFDFDFFDMSTPSFRMCQWRYQYLYRDKEVQSAQKDIDDLFEN